MDLVKRFAYGDSSLLELHLHQWQAVDEDRHIVAVGMGARLLKLPDDLYFVAYDVGFVQEVDVLDASIIEGEVVDVVVVYLACFVHHVLSRSIEILLDKPPPFIIGELHIIKLLQLRTHIGKHRFGGVEMRKIFIALLSEIFDELFFQGILALVGFINLPCLGVLVKDNEAVGLGNGFGVLKHIRSLLKY